MVNLQYSDYKKKKNWIEKLNEPLLLRVQFIKNSASNFDFYKNTKDKSFLNYIASHQELINSYQLNEATNNQTKNIKSNFSFLDYMNRDSSKKNFDNMDTKDFVWKYSNYYTYDNQESFSSIEKSYKSKWNLVNKNEVDDINNKSNIWSIIISEKELENGELLFKNQHLLVDRCLRSLFDFPVNAVASFHSNTTHPHIHIMAYQNANVPIKNINKWFKLDVAKFKESLKAINYLKFNNQKYWNDIWKQKKLIKQSMNEEQIFYSFMKDFKNISINIKGKYEYNKLSKKQKLLVDNFLNKLLTTNTNYETITNFQKIFNDWNKQCEFVLSTLISNISNDLVKNSIIEQFNKLEKFNEFEIKTSLLKMISNFDLKIQSSEFNNLNKFLSLKVKLDKTNLKNQFYKSINLPWKNKKALNIFKKIFLDDSNNISEVYSIANKNYYAFLQILDEANKLSKQKNFIKG